MNLAKILVAAVSCCALAGCLVPEKFTAEANFRSDGSYLYKFDGTVVHALAVMAEKQGKLTNKDRTNLRQDIEKASRSPGVKKLKAIDDTHYELSMEEVLQPESQKMPDSVEVFRVDNHEWKTSRTLTVTGPTMSPKDQQALKELGIKTEGIISVIVPSGSKVLEHNASGTPGLFSKAYTWKIGSLADHPKIRFQLPGQ